MIQNTPIRLKNYESYPHLKSKSVKIVLWSNSHLQSRTVECPLWSVCKKIAFVPLTHPHTVFVPGLSIRVRLLRSLPERYKVDIRVKPGSHQSEVACACDLWRLRYRMLTFSVQVNKQLNDKERVAAALENPTLLATVEQTLIDAGRRGQPG